MLLASRHDLQHPVRKWPLQFISNLMESGVEFVAVDMPQANRLTLHILAAVAEHEREMISQRTRAALAAAKARGTQLGDPRPESAKASAIASKQAADFRACWLHLSAPSGARGVRCGPSRTS